ncbi:MAG: hypothetical protein K2I00_02135 [Ruminococcus sp.]|nr:hypothetical protein [Ruminococcus sp.]
MPKLNIEFSGFDEAVKRLESLEGNVKKTAGEALKKSKQTVQKNLEKAMQKHNRTHATVKSLDNESGVTWVGGVGTIYVGFNIAEGGLSSVFLMYGTPRIKKDSKLYNAVYGKKIRDEIKKIQEEAFYDEIRRLSDS